MTDLPNRLPPLATLIAFEAAARHGSFTRAAEELILSQATISRRVRELESFLGVKLFERHRYDVEISSRGEAFASTVRKTLEELASATDHLRDFGAGLHRLTIFTDITIAQAIVVPALGEMQQRFPDLTIRLLSSSEPIESIREEFDIGFQYGRRAEDRYDITPFADDALFPVCSPGIAAQLPTEVTPENIVGQPLLHFAEPGRVWPDWHRFLASFDLDVPDTIDGLTFSSYQICLDVAAKGEGIALGWERAVAPRLESGDLVRVSNMTMKMHNAINIYRRKNSGPNTPVDELLQLLNEKDQ